MTQPWHTLPKARAILASCAHRIPPLIACDTTFYRTREEWCCYDPADPRVVKLRAIRNSHFLAAEATGGSEAALIAIGANVDAAIDAVQDVPLITNPNDPDELALRLMVRAQILGAQIEERAA